MSKTVNHLSIFLATPGDIEEERSIVKAVVTELNMGYCKQNSIHLDLVGWENMYPTIAEYPQEAVNNQAGDYDIFIGIMWSTFGTPTLTYNSGTEEEFNKAYQKYTNNPSELDVMFYFSNVPMPPNKLNLEQLGRVLEFKTLLSQKGVFRKEYSTVDEFSQMLRLNLIALLGDKSRRSSTQVIMTEKNIIPIEDAENSDSEIGFYEYKDMFLDTMDEANSTVGKLTDYMHEISFKVNESTSEINSLVNKPLAIREQELRKIIDSLGDHLMNFSNRMNVEIPILDDAFSKGISFLGNALNIQKTSFDEVDNLEGIDTLMDTLDTVADQMQEFKIAMLQTPPMTTKYNKAKKHAVKSIDTLINTLNSNKNLLLQVRELY